MRTKISVLMSVYKESKTHLKGSIESILDQTFKNFEFIIIDDGLQEQNIKICKEYANKDKRIIFIQNKKNQWLTKTLNKGLTLCKGKYIARMDADDIAHNKRLEKQFNFMEKNSEYILCGTRANFIDMYWKTISKKEIKLNKNRQIKLIHPLLNMFYHPTFFIRKEVLDKYKINYNPIYKTSQDYDLTLRLLSHGKMKNIDQKLIKYRINPNSISVKKNKQQIKDTLNILKAFLSYSIKNYIYIPILLINICIVLPIRLLLWLIKS